MHTLNNDEPPPGFRWIYTPTIRHKSGKVLVAAHYGLKAFRIKVPINPPQ